MFLGQKSLSCLAWKILVTVCEYTSFVKKLFILSTIVPDPAFPCVLLLLTNHSFFSLLKMQARQQDARLQRYICGRRGYTRASVVKNASFCNYDRAQLAKRHRKQLLEMRNRLLICLWDCDAILLAGRLTLAWEWVRRKHSKKLWHWNSNCFLIFFPKRPENKLRARMC